MAKNRNAEKALEEMFSKLIPYFLEKTPEESRNLFLKACSILSDYPKEKDDKSSELLKGSKGRTLHIGDFVEDKNRALVNIHGDGQEIMDKLVRREDGSFDISVHYKSENEEGKKEWNGAHAKYNIGFLKPINGEVYTIEDLHAAADAKHGIRVLVQQDKQFEIESGWKLPDGTIYKKKVPAAPLEINSSQADGLAKQKYAPLKADSATLKRILSPEPVKTTKNSFLTKKQIDENLTANLNLSEKELELARDGEDFPNSTHENYINTKNTKENLGGNGMATKRSDLENLTDDKILRKLLKQVRDGGPDAYKNAQKLFARIDESGIELGPELVKSRDLILSMAKQTSERPQNKKQNKAEPASTIHPNQSTLDKDFVKESQTQKGLRYVEQGFRVDESLQETEVIKQELRKMFGDDAAKDMQESEKTLKQMAKAAEKNAASGEVSSPADKSIRQFFRGAAGDAAKDMQEGEKTLRQMAKAAEKNAASGEVSSPADKSIRQFFRRAAGDVAIRGNDVQLMREFERQARDGGIYAYENVKEMIRQMNESGYEPGPMLEGKLNSYLSKAEQTSERIAARSPDILAQMDAENEIEAYFATEDILLRKNIRDLENKKGTQGSMFAGIMGRIRNISDSAVLKKSVNILKDGGKTTYEQLLNFAADMKRGGHKLGEDAKIVFSGMVTVAKRLGTGGAAAAGVAAQKVKEAFERYADPHFRASPALAGGTSAVQGGALGGGQNIGNSPAGKLFVGGTPAAGRTPVVEPETQPEANQPPVTNESVPVTSDFLGGERLALFNNRVDSIAALMAQIGTVDANERHNLLGTIYREVGTLGRECNEALNDMSFAYQVGGQEYAAAQVAQMSSAFEKGFAEKLGVVYAYNPDLIQTTEPIAYNIINSTNIPPSSEPISTPEPEPNPQPKPVVVSPAVGNVAPSAFGNPQPKPVVVSPATYSSNYYAAPSFPDLLEDIKRREPILREAKKKFKRDDGKIFHRKDSIKRYKMFENGVYASEAPRADEETRAQSIKYGMIDCAEYELSLDDALRLRQNKVLHLLTKSEINSIVNSDDFNRSSSKDVRNLKTVVESWNEFHHKEMLDSKPIAKEMGLKYRVKAWNHRHPHAKKVLLALGFAGAALAAGEVVPAALGMAGIKVACTTDVLHMVNSGLGDAWGNTIGKWLHFGSHGAEDFIPGGDGGGTTPPPPETIISPPPSVEITPEADGNTINTNSLDTGVPEKGSSNGLGSSGDGGGRNYQNLSNT